MFAIATMCRVLGVSTSGYYSWRRRRPSQRAVEDEHLAERIRHFYDRSDGTYGVPRIHADLADEGLHVGRKRVARLMQAAGLQGVTRRKGFRTTRPDKSAAPAPDLVKRDFTANGPDELWVADITYVPTRSGFLFLAVVLDAWSRRVVGWAMATHLKTELVLRALGMAIFQRRSDGVIHHSDRGCQYTALAFGKRCEEADIRPSMGSAGDCFDNALAESFFATLECELIDRRCWKSPAEAEPAIFRYIEGWHSNARCSSKVAAWHEESGTSGCSWR